MADFSARASVRFCRGHGTRGLLGSGQRSGEWAASADGGDALGHEERGRAGSVWRGRFEQVLSFVGADPGGALSGLNLGRVWWRMRGNFLNERLTMWGVRYNTTAGISHGWVYSREARRLAKGERKQGDTHTTGTAPGPRSGGRREAQAPSRRGGIGKVRNKEARYQDDQKEGRERGTRED